MRRELMLWMNPSRCRLQRRHSRAVAGLGGAEAARTPVGDAQPAQAPDPRGHGARTRALLDGGCGWCACEPRLTRPAFRARRRLRCSSLRGAGAGASTAPSVRNSRVLGVPSAAWLRSERKRRPARLAAARPDRAGARLPLVSEPMAGQQLPLRADLLGLCAGGAASSHGAAAGSYLTAGGSRAATLVSRRARPGAARLATAVQPTPAARF